MPLLISLSFIAENIVSGVILARFCPQVGNFLKVDAFIQMLQSAGQVCNGWISPLPQDDGGQVCTKCFHACIGPHHNPLHSMNIYGIVRQQTNSILHSIPMRSSPSISVFLWGSLFSSVLVVISVREFMRHWTMIHVTLCA